jgi:hypothetical protein
VLDTELSNNSWDICKNKKIGGKRLKELAQFFFHLTCAEGLSVQQLH